MGSNEERLDHGPRITEKEYEQGITSLYERSSTDASKTEKLSTLRKELDLTIDYRLGVNFPKDRRQKLWDIRRKTDASIAKNLVFAFSRSLLEYFTANLANKFLKEYREVLSEKEFNQFFDINSKK